MLINTISCCKPNSRRSFTGNSVSASEKQKVRYKHFEKLNDDILCARSIIKAHQDVQNSGKMRLYKAIPSITTGIIATSLALTQPGKLSAKAAAGLGFLALSAGVDKIGSMVAKNDKNEEKKHSLGVFALAIGAIAGGIAMAKGLLNTKAFEGINNFLTKEKDKLANEINSTKLSEFNNKYIQPLLEKYPRASVTALFGGTIGLGLAQGKIKENLLQGMSEDIKEKADENFAKAKLIQSIAKEHFDSVDAIEV